MQICCLAELRPQCSRFASAGQQKMLRSAADFREQAAHFKPPGMNRENELKTNSNRGSFYQTQYLPCLPDTPQMKKAKKNPPEAFHILLPEDSILYDRCFSESIPKDKSSAKSSTTPRSSSFPRILLQAPSVDSPLLHRLRPKQCLSQFPIRQE